MARSILLPIRVIAYSGYKSPELPRCIEIDGEMVSVESVERQWKEIDVDDCNSSVLLCFRVLLHNGGKAIVSYREKDHSWFLKE